LTVCKRRNRVDAWQRALWSTYTSSVLRRRVQRDEDCCKCNLAEAEAVFVPPQPKKKATGKKADQTKSLADKPTAPRR
jgi:hypothetical protein